MNEFDVVALTQRVDDAIRLAQELCPGPGVWNTWASNWQNGIDRTVSSADRAVEEHTFDNALACSLAGDTGKLTIMEVTARVTSAAKALARSVFYAKRAARGDADRREKDEYSARFYADRADLAIKHVKRLTAARV